MSDRHCCLAGEAVDEGSDIVVVPPISTTMASLRPVRKAAPRIELVGPEANVSTGMRRTASAAISEKDNLS